MSEVSNSVEKSTWATKFAALGPGIVMASAAVGGSHIIASTQAGAIYGWELVSIVILANLFKYPFFRFGVQYTLDNRSHFNFCDPYSIANAGPQFIGDRCHNWYFTVREIPLIRQLIQNHHDRVNRDNSQCRGDCVYA